MAEIAIIGAGTGGMLAALLLADDGHQVLVVERDAQPPPPTGHAAWNDWERPGVNQFRQPHGYEGSLRRLLSEELPDVARQFGDAGPVLVDLFASAPDPRASREPGDEWLAWEGLRRPTFELVLSRCVESRDNVEMRRGVVVKGLTTGPKHRPGVPHVSGVLCQDGPPIEADLVIDASGRRTPIQSMVEGLGRRVTTSSESDGFTYFTRWFHRDDGSLPPHPGIGGLMPGLLFLLFPGEAGVFALAVVGSIKDRPLRKLKDPERFMAVALATSKASQWVDPAVATPISGIMPMGSIQNRQLRLLSADGPSVTGLVNMADSATSTNPSLGRGVPLAAKYAQALRQVLRDHEDPYEIVTAYDEITDRMLTPWLHDSIESDASLREAFAVMVDPEHAPPRVMTDRRAIQLGAQVDMECWRAWYRVDQGFDMPSAVLGNEELISKARRLAAEVPPPQPDITRLELIDLLM